MQYHFIGIGGIGMSGIAKLLLRRGENVSGSDLKEGISTQQLRALGAQVFLGHDGINLGQADVVVYSSAVKENNPEMLAARSKGLPVIKRAEALAGLMKDKTVIAVTGSHGKTTTSSLISLVLLEAGLSPSIAVGGILKNIDTNACLGDGKFFVAEADESDGSFLYYNPDYAVITNIDHEHLDYYQSFGNALSAYGKFLRQTKSTGCAFLCADDPNLKIILEGYQNRHVLFGLSQDADFFAQNIRAEGLNSEFECFCKNKSLGRFSLALGGRHNISNALAVIAVALELGIDLSVVKNALVNYKGAKRRLEVKFKSKDYFLLDDYAHHPTEIKATLAAAANLTYKRMIAVFQPHRYSRTKLLLDDFAKSFDKVDTLVVTDIYAASEPPLAGVNKEALCQKVKDFAPEKKICCLSRAQIIPYLLKIKQPGDLIITLGAGDITKLSDELATELQK